LKKALPALQSSKRIDCLNELSELYWGMRIFDSAKQYALSAINESQKIGYPIGAGYAYYNLGNVNYEIGNFAEVVANADRAIFFFSQGNTQNPLAKAYLLLGQGIWAQSKFEAAKERFNKATQIFMHLHDPVGLGNSYALMAAEEEERGNYEESFQYSMRALQYNHESAFIPLGQLYADVGDYETSLDYYGRVRDRNMKIYVNLKIGETYYMAGKYDSAMYHYQIYIKDEGSLSPKLLSKPYALLGAVYLKLKDYNTALHYLTPALNDFKAENNRNWVMRVLLELGRTYQKMGQTNLAINSSKELLNDAEESGARQYARDAHYLLFELNDASGNKADAFRNLKQYTLLNNQISIDNSARKLAFYKTSHEREQAQLKIDLLNKQQQLQQEELKQTSQQRKFLAIGLLALILIGAVTVRNILLKKGNEKHLRELAENELQIQRLETKRQLGELEMLVLRTQMNPHFIFNSLNSINRFILQNNKLQASEHLTKFSRLVRMILQNSQSKLITLQQELESLEL
jgi:tetratricopeptide (TPR) repeat protein